MGTTPFPSSLYSCILADGYSAGDEEDVTSQEGSDLSELVLYNGTVWRASFTLRTKTSSDRNALLNFKAARNGGFDSFPFTAPDDATTRQVRFVECRSTHVARGEIWDYAITLREEL